MADMKAAHPPADPVTAGKGHCLGCQGWIEPEYLRREDCPGLAHPPETTCPSCGGRDFEVECKGCGANR